jgi:hypothetical protein
MAIAKPRLQISTVVDVATGKVCSLWLIALVFLPFSIDKIFCSSMFNKLNSQLAIWKTFGPSRFSFNYSLAKSILMCNSRSRMVSCYFLPICFFKFGSSICLLHYFYIPMLLVYCFSLKTSCRILTFYSMEVLYF